MRNSKFILRWYSMSVKNTGGFENEAINNIYYFSFLPLHLKDERRKVKIIVFHFQNFVALRKRNGQKLRWNKRKGRRNKTYPFTLHPFGVRNDHRTIHTIIWIDANCVPEIKRTMHQIHFNVKKPKIKQLFHMNTEHEHWTFFEMVENKRIMIPLLSYLNLSLILSIISIVEMVVFKAFPNHLLNASWNQLNNAQTNYTFG